MNIGHTWNESDTHTDPETGRRVRHLSTQGRINQTPTYHTNSGFTADSRYLVFVSVRKNATWVIRAEVATGELKALWKAPGIGDRNYSAFILDGDFTRDTLQWLYYNTDDTAPKLEPICKHNTEWSSVPGQYSHPHPLTDPSGKWISFTTAQNGRTDVCIVETQ